MDSGRDESLEERRRRLEGVAIYWRVYLAVQRGACYSIALNRADYMKLAIAAADHPGKYRLITELYGLPIHVLDELSEGEVVIS